MVYAAILSQMTALANYFSAEWHALYDEVIEETMANFEGLLSADEVGRIAEGAFLSQSTQTILMLTLMLK
jgi:hypothetical protein